MAITGLLLLTASLASLGDAAQNVLLLIADDMRPQAEPFDGTFGWEQQPVTTDGNAMQTPGLKVRACVCCTCVCVSGLRPYVWPRVIV